MRIFIDPGHGGSDPGAVGCGRQEKDMNLEYSLAIRNGLNGYENVEVVMSRDSDVDISLQDRTNIENASNFDLALSCHNNSFNGQATGSEGIYSITSSRNFIAFVDSMIRAVSNSLGVPFRRTFSKMGDGGSDYYHMIRNTICPCIIIECLFVDNPDDMAKWDPQKAANAIVNEIAAFYGLTKKPVPQPQPVVTAGTVYRVMAGSYRNRSNAEKRVEELKSLGIDATIMTATI